MITEDYVGFKTAKLLKEKGFNECCRAFRSPSRKLFYSSHDIKNFEDGKTIGSAIAAPTLQMAMKWLREEHDIIIVIEPHSYNHMEEKTSSYDFSIWYRDNYEHPLTTNYSTYEEAVEAAILYVLSEVL